MKKAPKKRRSAPRVLNFRVSSRAEQVERAEPGTRRRPARSVIYSPWPQAAGRGPRIGRGGRKKPSKKRRIRRAPAPGTVLRGVGGLFPPEPTAPASRRRRACPLTAAASADRYRSAYRGLPWVSVRPIGDGSSAGAAVSDSPYNAGSCTDAALVHRHSHGGLNTATSGLASCNWKDH